MKRTAPSFGVLARRTVGVLGGVAAIVAGVVVLTSPAAAQGPIIGAGRADAVQDSFIVQLKDSVSARAVSADTARDLTDEYGGQVRSTWQHALNGFSARMSADEAARLAADPRVASVEQDARVRLTDTQTNPPSWGLDRIDQRALPLSNAYNYASTAATVRVYVIDTGIRTTHTAFGGRASWGVNTTGDGVNADTNGHGTHVAGTIAGSAFGVAKAAKVVAVKVLDASGSGSITQVVDGVNWVTANAVKPAVVNMSLGASGSSVTLETAVRNSIDAGITYAISSGNDNADANNFTPARVAEAITVNASDASDRRASFSNFGSVTDLFAPGVGITSAWYTGDTATAALSGTSMASPHVAGAAALWLAARPSDSPAAVQSGLIGATTTGAVGDPGTGSPNRLLFTNPGAGLAPPPAPLVITKPANQISTVGTPVSLQLVASGGTAPYTWSAASLPVGLTINAAGLVSGTPTRAGLLTAKVVVKDAAGRTASLSFSWTVQAAPVYNPPAVASAATVAIPDLGTAVSPITITGPGYASAVSKIEVHIKHTSRNNLVVDLIAPDGTVFALHNRTGGTLDDLDQVFQRKLSGELAAGVWQLRVKDVVRNDVGTIVSWTLDA